jgi:isoquinoline 1-oxidoreductase alpha subunit
MWWALLMRARIALLVTGSLTTTGHGLIGVPRAGSREGESGMPAYHLTVNSVGYDVNVASNTPLLWVLRDVIGLTGTKYGCGIERCGACTIWLDGDPGHSCEMDVTEGVGRQITTIEGLSPNSSDPVQQAWIAHQVPQCGFCQSGVIMKAAAAMHAGATGPEAVNEVDNLCVCGTYQRMREALNGI